MNTNTTILILGLAAIGGAAWYFMAGPGTKKNTVGKMPTTPAMAGGGAPTGNTDIWGTVGKAAGGWVSSELGDLFS
jgi:hypothetical protein